MTISFRQKYSHRFIKATAFTDMRLQSYDINDDNYDDDDDDENTSFRQKYILRFIRATAYVRLFAFLIPYMTGEWVDNKKN